MVTDTFSWVHLIVKKRYLLRHLSKKVDQRYKAFMELQKWDP